MIQIQTEHLFYNALDAISFHCPANFFAGGNAKPSHAQNIRMLDQDIMLAVMLLAMILDFLKVSPLLKRLTTLRRWIHAPALHDLIELNSDPADLLLVDYMSFLYCDSFPPPAASLLNDFSASLCMHSLKKTVGPFPSNITGLISSLHVFYASAIYRFRIFIN